MGLMGVIHADERLTPGFHCPVFAEKLFWRNDESSIAIAIELAKRLKQSVPFWSRPEIRMARIEGRWMAGIGATNQAIGLPGSSSTQSLVNSSSKRRSMSIRLSMLIDVLAHSAIRDKPHYLAR